MYKLLLCLRYLRTRYLAFICIVSVMLGVATLIVVNAVMSGFSTKLKDRLHGVLSDVVVDTDRPDGFVVCGPDGYPVPQRGPDGRLLFDADGNPVPTPLDPDEAVRRIMASPAGPRIAAVSPTIESFAVLQFQFRGQTLSKPVRLIGVDPKGRAAVGGFSEYLVRQNGAPSPSFELTPDALDRHERNRRDRAAARSLVTEVPDFPQPKPPAVPGLPEIPAPAAPAADVFAVPPPDQAAMRAEMPVARPVGVILGYTLGHFRYKDADGQVVEERALQPGDAVTVFTAGGEAGGLRPVWGSFLVTDYLKTEMSEYDQSFVYVPLEDLQRVRTMQGRCTAFQIRLKDYEADKGFVTEQLRALFPQRAGSRVATWEEHQGSLLAAIDVEKGILNLLLFLIVGVAGFSILAIFTMIVSEKYRDIGVMKSLGASSRGVMSIFVGYGLLLGLVGCALGTGLGLAITDNINGIERFLTEATGKAVFPRDVYYFKEIPTNVEPVRVLFLNLGAVGIAVLFSLLPAWRAARLHPVQALRFE